MKKKNGFTLIELLAVIVILAIILAIVLPKIFNNISNSTEQFYKEQESILKEATLKYLNNEYIDSNTSVITITKEDLINAGYISEIYDVNNGNSVCDATIIVYSLSSNPKIKVLLSCENYNSDGVDETYLVVNLNEGSTSQIFEEKYTYGTKITLINPTKVGYTFTGWTVEGEGASLNGSELTTGIETTTITANWERNYVTLTVNLNEGSTTQSFEETYYSLSTLSLINPTKEGYTFTGWTVEGTGASINGTELTIGTSATTITANWEKELVNPVLSYSCYNAKAGSSPYVLNYTGNCTVIDDGDGNWRVKFLTSGTLTMSSAITIDAFLVGGGGGGFTTPDGGGGGGGYTLTRNYINLSATSYTITIGSGGDPGSAGGTTSAFGQSAAGGNPGLGSSSNYAGGSGGSGGGSLRGQGGSNGSRGYKGNGTEGDGQNRNTYEFGIGSGTLYAGGGGGGFYNSSTTGGAGGGGGYREAGTANTGGGGGCYATGGSGIVVIRNSQVITIGNNKFYYTGAYTVENSKIKLLTSGTLYPQQDTVIDAFLVGGGGGSYTNSDGGGGAGGKTLTITDYILTKGASYMITVGAGGAVAEQGESTIAFDNTATGGGPGLGSSSNYAGGSGGSGGGPLRGNGGSDGSNGGNGSGTVGTGQGTTTREFGESTGTLYAGGGGGGFYNNSTTGGAGGGGNGSSNGTFGEENTGGGGGAGNTMGGSGIVIIRNASS